MARLLCIGGPNVGHYIDVPEDAHRIQYVAMPKLPADPSKDTMKLKVKVHSYRVEVMRMNSQPMQFLVHDSMRADWLFEVINRYAKRHKRAR